MKIYNDADITVLVAEPNMVLTDGVSFSSLGGKAYLPPTSSADRWYEVTEEKAIEMQQENETNFQLNNE